MRIMGHKTHPYGFRLGIIKDWKAHWYAPNGSAYRGLVREDLELRDSIRDEYRAFSDAGIAKVEIDRGAQDSVINIHSARPGILIGRDGERVKNLRARLESITRSRVQLNILEIEQPELNAYLVARNVADQLERRVAYRRAMRQSGAEGHAGRRRRHQDHRQGAYIRLGNRPHREDDDGSGAPPHPARRH